jgi:hypothetical protein
MVFLSYSHANITLARHVEEGLREAGISSWFDENRIPVGTRFVSAIGRALHGASVFLAIDSEAAAASYWVNREIQAAGRLRSQHRLEGIVVLSTSASPFLSSEPDARISSVDLIEKTVQSFVSRISLKTAPGTAEREAVQMLDPHGEEESLWLGFSQELRCLDNWWFSGKSGMWISGPGGSGKTSLVRTWVHAFREIGYRELQSALVMSLYIHQGDPKADAILREIVDGLARLLGTYMSNDRSHQDPIELDLARLGLRVRERHVLLVINSPESMDAGELLKVLHAVGNCGLRVIVTARNSMLRQLQADYDCIQLNQMSNADARLLVGRHFQQQEADPIVARLIDALGGHPLAISLAIKEMDRMYPPSRASEAAEDLLRLLTQADPAGEQEQGLTVRWSGRA